MVGLLSLPKQSHLAAVIISFKCVPNYLGNIRYRNYRLGRKGVGGKMIEPLYSLYKHNVYLNDFNLGTKRLMSAKDRANCSASAKLS